MRPRFRSTYGWIAGCALLLLVLFGCTENITDPESPQFAKPAAVDEVVVSATEPDSAVQDTTLFVDVLGDGFDDGSIVEFLIDSTVAPKLKVKNTRYVTKKKLTVELEVDATAELLKYDVRVSTTRGPKGIGTELFRVVERVKANSSDLNVESFIVTEVDPSESPLCLEGEICNKLTLLYTGRLDSISFMVRPILSDIYFDESVEGNWRVSGNLRRYATEFLVPQISGQVTTFWQGQWRPEFWTAEFASTYLGDVETIPNLAPLGTSTQYSFSYIYGGAQGVTGSSVAAPFDQFGPRAYAHYRGWTSDQLMYVVADDFSVVVLGKNKWIRSYLELEVQAFSDPLIRNGQTSVWANINVLHTAPDGHRVVMTMLSEGVWHSTEPDIYKTVYRTAAVSETGCHTFQVIGAEGLTGLPEPTDHTGDHRFVWDPSQDPVGAAPFSLYFNAETNTVQEGCGG